MPVTIRCYQRVLGPQQHLLLSYWAVALSALAVPTMLVHRQSFRGCRNASQASAGSSVACCLTQTPTTAPLPLHSWHSAHLQWEPPLSPPPCLSERRPALPSAAMLQGQTGVGVIQPQGILLQQHHQTRAITIPRRTKLKGYPVMTTWADKQEVDWVRLGIPALLLT